MLLLTLLSFTGVVKAQETMNYLGGSLVSLDPGKYVVYYQDANGAKHYLKNDKESARVVSTPIPSLYDVTLGNVTEGYAPYAYFFDMGQSKISNPEDNDAMQIQVEVVGKAYPDNNYENNRLWESQVIFKNDDEKYAIRTTNCKEKAGWRSDAFITISEDGQTVKGIQNAAKAEDVYKWTIEKVVAKIGENYYATALSALMNAKDGDVVTFLKGKHTLGDLTHQHFYANGDKSPENLTIQGDEGDEGEEVVVDKLYFNTLTFPKNLTVKNLVIDGEGAGEQQGLSSATAVSDLTVKGCTFKNGAYLSLANEVAENITVENCIFVGTGSEQKSSAVYIQKVKNLTIGSNSISGGFYNAIQCSSSTDGTVNITENTISGTNDRAFRFGGNIIGKVNIGGNTITDAADDDEEVFKATKVSRADGGQVEFSENTYNGEPWNPATIYSGTDVVCKSTFAALAGYKGYATLQGAIDGAAEGQTVTMLADATTEAAIVINKAITLDGNEKKLTSTLATTAGRAINVREADEVTIQNLTIDAKGERAINVIQGAKKVNITNVTATAKNYAVNAATSAPNTVISISNSELSGLNVVNIAAPGAKITVDRTILNCNDQSDAEGYAALCLGQEADGASISATGVTFNITCDEATPSHKAKCNVATGSITIGGSEDEVKKAVAVVEYLPGPYYYAFSSLQAAFDKAKEEETVKLVNDVVVDEAVKINKLVTLDFNGFEITPADNLSASAFEVTGELCFKNKAEGSIADGLIYYIINDADYKAEAGKTFNLTEDKEGVSIVYKRTFSHDGWQVLYVPFDIKLESVAEEFDVYTISNITNAVKLEELTEETLSANTPYIIKAKNEITEPKEMYFKANSVTLYGQPENYTKTIGDYTITGTYTSKAIEAGQQYVLTNGKWCQLLEAAVINEKNILGAFRVYLIANEVAGNASVLRNVINGSDATAIDELKAEEGNNSKTNIYDLSGRRVEKAVKGVFVVNGKKVVK